MREALLEAIEHEPFEALPRLAFADWLDDNGESDLAFAYRWAVRKGRVPDILFEVRSWYCKDCNWTYTKPYDLPREVFSNMILNWNPFVTRLSFEDSPKAYEALARALATLNCILN